ncbi:bifunctional 2',3'-cyclic-nucleotide 2'-phosphodiesterase/3'-nucleotidase [Aliagarivorans taiwanensis]|uniref:bifunctional 2',3'-cyclic-nucleotide 2'-phosphodiesterase/3'-nucleotidase n=1 Tax=Aliagarivorans taiwanensis TaxID=561966 RepID=UPI0004236209|nr:bifunctional 2',3'-cyclic-nucleotide 2'-phosphodiesterase/3'-nucleotidase [Aliagarivorans taiwanensis]
MKNTFSGKSLLRLSATAVACSLLAACGGSSSDSEQPYDGETLTIRLMETTDIHANMRSFNYFTSEEDPEYGFSRTALIIDKAREEQPNSFLVDNGDLIQGSPFGDYVAKELGAGWLGQGNIHPIYRAMNHVGYDVANIGNHEFNFGLEFLDASIAGADFPYVSANVFYFEDAKVDGHGVCRTAIDKHYNGNYDAFFENETPYFAPYELVEKTYISSEGREVEVTVGVIGFVPPQIMGWDKSHLECQVQVADIVKAAEYYVPKMIEEGAEIVVAVPHSGLSRTGELPDYEYDYAENASGLLAQVDGIDAIMFGHDHVDFPHESFADYPGADVKAGTLYGVPAVMPGFWGNKLGVIDLTYKVLAKDPLEAKAGGIITDLLSADVKLMDIDETEGEHNEDARIVAEVAAEHEGTVEYMAEEIGESDQAIYSFFSLAGPDLSVQLVNEAQMWRGEQLKSDGAFGDNNDLPMLAVAAPFRGGRNGPSDFTYVPAGPITLSNVADLYIFPNTLQVVKLTGAGVIEWLEMSAGQFNTIAGRDDEQALKNAGFQTYNFDIFFGIEYEIDISVEPRYEQNNEEPINPDSNRIANVTYQGEPLDLEQEFLIITNNHRASGSGNFPGVGPEAIVYEDPEETRNHIQNYLEFLGDEADGGVITLNLVNNWKLTLGDTGHAPGNVRLATSPRALDYVSDHAQIEALNEQDADGYELFRVHF